MISELHMEKNRDKSVLVTGALRGIGRAVSLRLAAEGYRVVLNYRGDGEDRANELKSEIERLGGAAGIIKFDVADKDECSRALGEYLKSNQVFWGIVLNAGICRDGLFPVMSQADWTSVVDTNLNGFYNVLRPVVMPMCKKREGRIVVISSVSGLIGNKGQVNYSASKAGLIVAAKALALEVASRSITVNAIAPGVIETDMTESLDKTIADMIPLKRFGKSEEVAALTAFLLSEEAGYITREVISINGGLH